MKLKKIIKSKGFIWSEIILFSILLGIPFFVSGKTFVEYLSSLTAVEIFWAIVITFIIGIIVEKYGRKIFR